MLQTSSCSIQVFISCFLVHLTKNMTDPINTVEYSDNTPNSPDTTNFISTPYHTILQILEASLHPRIPKSETSPEPTIHDILHTRLYPH
jgi:hypothetical protein